MLTLLLLFIHTASAQQTVRGRVTSAETVVSGVTIQLKGTAVGTQTNARGEFSINAPANGVLLVSAIGFGSMEVPVGGQSSLNIALQSADQQLHQVVVMGYGTQSKRKLTSAVATVSGEVLNKRVATNPTALLQGQLPGLQVVQGSGGPGNEKVSLRIRGVSTFSGAGNEPLVIVDGLPGSMANLNPNDIESVSLLKDAARPRSTDPAVRTE